MQCSIQLVVVYIDVSAVSQQHRYEKHWGRSMFTFVLHHLFCKQYSVSIWEEKTSPKGRIRKQAGQSSTCSFMWLGTAEIIIWMAAYVALNLF